MGWKTRQIQASGKISLYGVLLQCAIDSAMHRHLTQCHPFHVDLIDVIAKDIVSNHKTQWPFLQNVIILLPNYDHVTSLQKKILAEANLNNSTTPLAAPQFYTFKDYINKTTALNQKTLPQDARELILMEALLEHKNLFGQHSPLTTAYALLGLFDELTRQQISLPKDLNQFILQLENAYQCQRDKTQALSKEAQIVHTLWFAWHQQLQQLNCLDKESQYQLKLAKNLTQDTDHFFYIAGFYDFLPAETQWLNARLEKQTTHLYFQADLKAQETKLVPDFPVNTIDSENNRQRFFQSVFDTESEPLLTRAQQIAKECQPLTENLSTLTAQTFEEEAQIIALQVRLWLKQKQNRLALILEDRCLARRVRALLQRSGIGLLDAEGWALSTTTAASVIESWLQCIEENFHCMPLLDILKSPFAFQQDDEHSESVYRFEQDLMARENISRDLQRYHQGWLSRKKKLSNQSDETFNHLPVLINHLQQASEKLTTLYKSNSASLTEYLETLKTALVTLGAYDLLAKDDAGKVILSLIEKLLHATTLANIDMDWMAFRHWLGLKLEENNFRPITQSPHAVALFHLSQPTLGQYDGIIIGGMTKEQFPGTSQQAPFFNENVRQDLGLNSSASENHLKFCYFRRLLESAPKVLLSYHAGPQESLPSPWFELLSRFHQLAFSQTLENKTLHHVFQQYNALEKNQSNEIFTNQDPVINESQLPDSLSASAHQSLIQCPYAFFAGQVLKLRASDDVSEKLTKSDYGERIHLCLQAFHAGGVPQVDGPFPDPVTSENKTRATQCLNTIAHQVFAQDLEDNFQHRGWLKRWLNIIPAYIDWQITHKDTWQFKSGEIKTSTALDSEITLHGRVDRIDTSTKNIGIIDYKTGQVPHLNAVNTGEAVQLIHYAMAYPDPVARVAYLQFESGQKDVAEKCIIEEGELDQLMEKTRERLIDLIQAIKKGAVLPAWGDKGTCQYCQFSGLCRHKMRETLS